MTAFTSSDLSGAERRRRKRRSEDRSTAVHIIDSDLGQWHKIGAAMFVLAAIGLELVPLLGDLVFSNPWVMHVCAAACLLQGAAFPLIPQGALVRFGQFVVWGGAAVITVLVATSTPVSWFALFYFWPMLAATYVYSRGMVLTFVLSVYGAYAIALAISGAHASTPYPLLEYLMFVLEVSTVMVAVRGLREGLDHLLEQLQVLSSTDALTGLANRRTFEEAFARASEHATKAGQPLTVLLFDLDHFKAINDAFGHPAGDAALRRFAELLRGVTRQGDTAARIGGEEFALIMPGAGAEAAKVLATAFAATLRADHASDPGYPALTVSIGVAELQSQVSSSATLLIEADRALYEAKRTGRDRVVIATGALSGAGAGA